MKEVVQKLLGFVGLVCIWVYFCCCSVGCLLCGELGLCKVGIAGWSVGVECVGRSGSVVTCWGRMEGEGVDKGKEWMTRGRKSS
jgi:hypothetical protein